MAANILQRYRPADLSSEAIRGALEGLEEERGVQSRRIAEQTERRTGLLVRGTDRDLASAEAAIADAALTIERIDAMAEELRRQLVEAVAAEAAETRRRQVQEAAAAVEAFNKWFAAHYQTHAQAIAQGIALEEDAYRKLRGVASLDLPPIAKGIVGPTKLPLFQLVRLPGAEEGQEPFFWPDRRGDPSMRGRKAVELPRGETMTLFVAKGRSVSVSNGETKLEGELVTLLKPEAARLKELGVLQETPPELEPPPHQQEPNPARIGLQQRAVQGPDYYAARNADAP